MVEHPHCNKARQLLFASSWAVECPHRSHWFRRSLAQLIGFAEGLPSESLRLKHCAMRLPAVIDSNDNPAGMGAARP